jgi:hypothetical protein
VQNVKAIENQKLKCKKQNDKSKFKMILEYVCTFSFCSVILIFDFNMIEAFVLYHELIRTRFVRMEPKYDSVCDMV